MRYNIIKQCSVYYAKFNTPFPLILDRDGFRGSNAHMTFTKKKENKAKGYCRRIWNKFYIITS